MTSLQPQCSGCVNTESGCYCMKPRKRESAEITRMVVVAGLILLIYASGWMSHMAYAWLFEVIR